MGCANIAMESPLLTLLMFLSHHKFKLIDYIHEHTQTKVTTQMNTDSKMNQKCIKIGQTDQ